MSILTHGPGPGQRDQPQRPPPRVFQKLGLAQSPICHPRSALGAPPCPAGVGIGGRPWSDPVCGMDFQKDARPGSRPSWQGPSLKAAGTRVGACLLPAGGGWGRRAPAGSGRAEHRLGPAASKFRLTQRSRDLTLLLRAVLRGPDPGSQTGRPASLRHTPPAPALLGSRARGLPARARPVRLLDAVNPTRSQVRVETCVPSTQGTSCTGNCVELWAPRPRRSRYPGQREPTTPTRPASTPPMPGSEGAPRPESTPPVPESEGVPWPVPTPLNGQSSRVAQGGDSETQGSGRGAGPGRRLAPAPQPSGGRWEEPHELAELRGAPRSPQTPPLNGSHCLPGPLLSNHQIPSS